MMQEKVQTISPQIVALIEQTIRESMQQFGLRQVSVRAGEDYDGDPVIFVEAQYDLSERPIEAEVTANLTSALRDQLWKQGETRFPHIEHRFDERQKVSRPRRAKA
jgi:hypothetical protein